MTAVLNACTEAFPPLAGPFISGSTYRVLHLGQRPLSGAHSDDDDSDAPPQKRKATGSKGKAGKGSAPGARRGRGAVTLQDLIDAELIAPGKNKLAVVYKGKSYSAGLGRTGNILYQGVKYHSATSFSIHCKRQQTPGKQGDDGWKSVLYDGKPLEHYRKLYNAALEGSGGAAAATARPASRAALDDEMDDEMDEFKASPTAAGGGAGSAAAAAAAAATDQWVQCDRCRTWRIVPDSSWPEVEADDREVWYCSDATWDLTKTSPFTPSCS